MRSESEVRWVRARNNVGQMTKLSDWHSLVPGMGDLNLPPGTSCSTGLSGSLQFAQHSGMRNMDGRIHEECMKNALDYISAIDPSPGQTGPRDPDRQLSPPKTAYTGSPRGENPTT